MSSNYSKKERFKRAEFAKAAAAGSVYGIAKIALHDFRAILADDRYRAHFSSWHSYNEKSNTCYVCLAGAVIAGTFGINYNESAPDDDAGDEYEWFFTFTSSYKERAGFRALDCLRRGEVDNAYVLLGSAKIDYDELPSQNIVFRNFRNKKQAALFADSLERFLPVLKKFEIDNGVKHVADS